MAAARPLGPDPTTIASGISRSGAEGAAVEPDPLAEEPLPGAIPREQDEDLERDREPARRRPGPRPVVGAGQCRDLEDALRPDDDLGQVEAVVGERGEQLRVERTRAVMAFPALPGRDELVDAGLGQGRDQPVDVAPVLRDRVADPEPLDPAQLSAVEVAAEPLPDGVHARIVRAGLRVCGEARSLRARTVASARSSSAVRTPTRCP